MPRALIAFALALSWASLVSAQDARPPRPRPYLTLTADELDAIERGSWEDVGLGVGLMLGGVAAGLAVAVPLGVASEIRGERCVSHGWFSFTCTNRIVVVGHHDDLLAGAIAASALALVHAIVVGVAILRPAHLRRRDLRWERRMRRETLALDVGAAPNGARVELTLRF